MSDRYVTDDNWSRTALACIERLSQQMAQQAEHPLVLREEELDWHVQFTEALYFNAGRMVALLKKAEWDSNCAMKEWQYRVELEIVEDYADRGEKKPNDTQIKAMAYLDPRNQELRERHGVIINDLLQAESLRDALRQKTTLVSGVQGRLNALLRQNSME